MLIFESRNNTKTDKLSINLLAIFNTEHVNLNIELTTSAI